MSPFSPGGRRFPLSTAVRPRPTASLQPILRAIPSSFRRRTLQQPSPVTATSRTSLLLICAGSDASTNPGRSVKPGNRSPSSVPDPARVPLLQRAFLVAGPNAYIQGRRVTVGDRHGMRQASQARGPAARRDPASRGADGRRPRRVRTAPPVQAALARRARTAPIARTGDRIGPRRVRGPDPVTPRRSLLPPTLRGPASPF